MISPSDRINAVNLIDEAVTSGARRTEACKNMGINDRTYRRWTAEDEVRADARPESARPSPPQKFNEEETQRVLEVCHDPQYANLPPGQIVPILADKGEYVGSESTIYRILHAANEQHHRGRAKAPVPRRQPTSHQATAPNQVWSWDVSYLNSPVRGQYYYLYLILDIFSRKIVGWNVHDCELGEHAATLVHKAVLAECCVGEPLVLHADNGSIQKGSTLRAKLEHLGVTSSFSRPRVSNDNPYSESLFRTCKYCPEFPAEGFESLEAARQWMARFVYWYNEVHRHSGVKHVTPAQRHRNEDQQILEKRKLVYEQAKAKNPDRWSGSTRNWERVDEVWLNPERKDTSVAPKEKIAV